MNIGPLGFPRLTNVGPLVDEFNEKFSQPVINREEFDDVFEDVLDNNDIEDRTELTDEDKSRLARSLGFRAYPTNEPVDKAKRARFFNCMKNKWARKWAKGLARETDSADLDDDSSMFRLRFGGCVSLTETNVPDDVRLIDERFTEDRGDEVEDATPKLPESIP